MGREREMPLLATLCWFVLTFEATLGQSLTGTAGEAVSLSCGSNSGCTWSKDGVELVLEDRSDQARYSFGSSCSLTIEPLLPGDEGEYECNSGKSRHRLTVLVEVGVPYIEEGRHGTLEVEDGHQVELRCTSQGGKPAAEIEWKRDGQTVIELDRIFEEVTRMGDGWKTQSTFTFRPQESTNVTCSASNEVMREPRVSSALEVRVRGRPRVEVRVDQEVIREGDSFEVLCKSSAYPEDVGYRWFFSGSELEGMTDNALLIEEISRMYDQADITCLVENEEGQGQGSTQLNVQFPPSIVLHPRSQVAKRKENVTFHCAAEGNPVPSYVWTVGREDSLLRAGTQNLSLVASEKTEAVYRCHVFSDGNEIVSSLPASLTLIRKPVVKMESERWASLGQDVILNCKTKAVSNRTRLVWLRSNGKEGDLEPVKEGERLEVITQYQDWQRTSRLLLKNVKVDDYGEYACFAENQVGTDLAMTQLMVKSSVDILSVVAAITCILGVLLLLAIFVYIRLKRNCCQELPQEKC